jgi:hypothetical protein
MKERQATAATRPDETQTVHWRMTEEEYHNNQRKSPPTVAKDVLEHIMEKVKLVILLASVPVLLVVLAGLCVLSIGLDPQQYRIGRNALDV